MEIIPEGKHFRLVHESELPEILVTLERYLPESLKVCIPIFEFINYYFHLQLYAWLDTRNIPQMPRPFLK